METVHESITGSLAEEDLGLFLRGAAETFGGLWDVEEILEEVEPMAAHHIGRGGRVRVVVERYPERRLLVRLDDEQTGVTVQRWEFTPFPY